MPLSHWTDVYRATYPDLVRYLHRKVWDEDRARDLAQEAFARARRRLVEAHAGLEARHVARG
jgi:DNA-directed RNA polymerase specialized sigma24 family protein